MQAENTTGSTIISYGFKCREYSSTLSQHLPSTPNKQLTGKASLSFMKLGMIRVNGMGIHSIESKEDMERKKEKLIDGMHGILTGHLRIFRIISKDRSSGVKEGRQSLASRDI